jgi:hypothetical protein
MCPVLSRKTKISRVSECVMLRKEEAEFRKSRARKSRPCLTGSAMMVEAKEASPQTGSNSQL